MTDRHLEWSGWWNARDLGGLQTTSGHVTRWGAIVRADALDGLSADGWSAVLEHGVRTIIDLRNDDEIGEDATPRPAAITTLRVPLDVSDDREFWDVWDNGPLRVAAADMRHQAVRAGIRAGCGLDEPADKRSAGVEGPQRADRGEALRGQAVAVFERPAPRRGEGELDQAGAGKAVHVVRDGGQAQPGVGERARELRGAPLPVLQPDQDADPGGVGERAEHGGDGFQLVPGGADGAGRRDGRRLVASREHHDESTEYYYSSCVDS